MSINFPKAEEEILAWWAEIDAFQTQVKESEGRPSYTFYDGPPFATGLPHYGHLLASTIKDIIPRYWSMKGHHVVRRFGWDTHGVPIEYEIDKKHGVSGRDAVDKMGLEKYNAECRAIVMRFAEEWRQTIGRLGRWIDFDNDYKTMNSTFMESIWWACKKLFDDGHIYRAYQIMPYSTALNTPLSNFEAQQNYRDTQDPAITVSFPLADDPNTYILTYTTTPWTLPSNIAICVNPDFEYVKIFDEASGRNYIILESRLSTIYKDMKKAKYKILEKISGKDMLGWKYQPMFDYFKDQFSHAFKVISGPFVTADEGTGLVQTSPAFGPEDYDAAMADGIISHKVLPPNPVDDAGCFTAEVPDYQGQHVKVADKAILKYLRSSGRLIVDSQATHSVKFCWRSDTPLINKAVFSWFVRVTDSIPDMLGELEKTNWVPGFVKERRFANWISNARDWNISRNRYWGTPIPIWVSDDYEEVVCVGSIEELKKLSGWTEDITDLHRDKIDKITIPSQKGKGQLKRIPEIFDCWFESGSMPYAAQHYPFEHKDDFVGTRFPADFIAEGLDQTRGWFYTLVVLGIKLFGVCPFQNCVVSGIVLAEDGKKMSKRLKNYPDPQKVMDVYGSDALRMYLINSPVVRAETIRFKESGVKEVVAKVLLPLWNSYRFFDEQVALLKKHEGVDFVFDPFLDYHHDSNVMDRWILANCQSLLHFVNQEMAAYRLYTVVPRLLRLIDDLTNWYIRFNRRRLKGQAENGVADTVRALNALCDVLVVLVRALAPFIPFLTEHIYQLLLPRLPENLPGRGSDGRSVHFLSFPEPRDALFDENVERRVSRMQRVIDLARTARERCNTGLKTPLRTLVVLANSSHLEDIRSLQSYIREELNIRDIVLTEDEKSYNIRLRAMVADWPRLGEKLKKDTQKVRKALPNLTTEQLESFIRDKYIIVDGIRLEAEDLTVVREMDKDAKASAEEDAPKWESASDSDIVILLDAKQYPELFDEGIVRDLVSRVQRLRKKAGLVPTDEIRMEYQVLKNPAGLDVERMVASQQQFIQNAVRGPLIANPSKEANGAAVNGNNGKLIAEEDNVIGDLTLSLKLLKV